MKKIILMLGTLLITITILISGSAVAGWNYIMRVDSETDCMNASNALYCPDGNHATIGANATFGNIILDLGTGTSMAGGQEFIVYASSDALETYKIRLISDPSLTTSSWWYGRNDTMDEYFTAPSPPDYNHWRYFEIESEQGVSTEGDPLYGSEIDAIGFYHI